MKKHILFVDDEPKLVMSDVQRSCPAIRTELRDKAPCVAGIGCAP